MKLPRFIRRSFDLTQATAVLLASLIISLILSTIQLTYTFKNQQRAAIELSEEILTLAEGGATTASWTLDNGLADEVLQSVITLGDVQTVTLRDEEGVILATANSTDKTYSRPVSLFATMFIGNSIRGQRELEVSTSTGKRGVGVLSVVLASEHIAQRFFSVASPVLVAVIFQALAIALVLLWMSSRLVTSPLRDAARAIANIDPENPGSTVLVIPAVHQDNEFGLLLSHTNKMVARLGSVQEQFKTLATHDPLTKLPNRSFVVSRLERALERAGRNSLQVAVLFLDLDGFKTVNDSHGHTRGDELLLKVATRLRDALRTNDSVGRLGGDEFLIVLEDIIRAEDVIPTAQRIKDAFVDPFKVSNTEVRINCSIGVALYPHDGSDTSELMRHADMAMYEAKLEHGNYFHFFAQEMSDRMQARLKMETSLAQALERDEFKLAYQPKIDATTGQLAGCEVLLRWQHKGQLIPASVFIESAEQTGLIVDIGYQVLERACAQVFDWNARGLEIPVAINVSAQQLRDADFTRRVMETARSFNVSPSMIELEITETVLIEELDHAVEKLEKLRNAGFLVSIDDFGTGYSSLSYLTHLPANSLKIDRSFVSGPQSSEVVLDMIIAMAKSLKLTTIAEGVETVEQKNNLLNKGCDVLQGYYFGKPMLAIEFEQRFLKPAA